MDIYASDEEKGEEIKQWWRDNGRAVIIGIVLGGMLIFLGRYWLNYQTTLTEQASLRYQHLTSLMTEDKKAEADEIMQQLFSEFSSTPYAVFSAFDMAKKAAENNDTDTAKTYLQWIIDHAELTGHKAIAKLRLSELLLSESQYDLAFKLATQPAPVSFTSLFAEVQGDILVAQGKDNDARAAYQTAMMSLEQGEPRQNILQVKLDDVATAQ